MHNKLSLCLATVLLCVLVCPVCADDPPIKALLVAGGCCHDYEHQKDVLAKQSGMLSKLGVSKDAEKKVQDAIDKAQKSILQPGKKTPDLKKLFKEQELNLSGVVKPSEATRVGQLTDDRVIRLRIASEL